MSVPRFWLSLMMIYLLKDTMASFIYIQAVCYLLWDAPLGVWTWLCMLLMQVCKGIGSIW